MSIAETILRAALRLASRFGVDVNELEVWVSPELRDRIKQEPPEQNLPGIPPDIRLDLAIRVAREGVLEPGCFVFALKLPKPVTTDLKMLN